MLRMSFDQLLVKTIKELSLSVFILVHASCMRVRPIFMCANTFFMRTRLCSSVDTNTYPSMHAETLHTHMQILQAQAGT